LHWNCTGIALILPVQCNPGARVSAGCIPVKLMLRWGRVVKKIDPGSNCRIYCQHKKLQRIRTFFVLNDALKRIRPDVMAGG
jgi:hypothetical protein